MCIRQYPKKHTESASQDRNKSINRNVRTLFLYIGEGTIGTLVFPKNFL